MQARADPSCMGDLWVKPDTLTELKDEFVFAFDWMETVFFNHDIVYALRQLLAAEELMFYNGLI